MVFLLFEMFRNQLILFGVVKKGVKNMEMHHSSSCSDCVDSGIDQKFIPSAAEWNRYYAKWFDPMVSSLWSFGSPSDVRDAVQDAFLKVLGLSDRYHLEGELEPRTESGWYGFIVQQAKWMLGHARVADGAWRSDVDTIKELEKNVRACVKSGRNDGGRLLKYLVVQEGEQDDLMRLPYDRMEESELQWLVREFVSRVAKKHGMAFRNYKAFMMHVLDEFTLDEIVDRIWGRGVSAAKRAQYKGDLYVIKSRMLVWLRKDVDYFEAV